MYSAAHTTLGAAMKLSLRKSYIAAAVAIVVVSLAAVFVYWRATAALRTERHAAESARTLKFLSRPLAPAIDSGFEWLSAPAQFREAAEFDGHLYMATFILLRPRGSPSTTAR